VNSHIVRPLSCRENIPEAHALCSVAIAATAEYGGTSSSSSSSSSSSNYQIKP
jgi:hypothetical protein